MNNLFSGKYILSFSVAAVVLVAGGVFVWSQMSQNPNDNNASSEEYIDIVEKLEVQKENDYTRVNSPDVFVEYSYEINPTTRLIFRETGQEAWDKGDVILEKQGNERVIKPNTELSSPSFFGYSVSSTNTQNIYVLSSGIVDVLAYSVTQDYLDVDKKEIVLSVQNKQMQTITVTKGVKGDIDFTIEILINDECGTDLEREGKTAQVIDLLVNGSQANLISTPIEIECASGRNDYLYNPNVLLDESKVSSDFTQMRFALKGVQISSNASQEIWKKDFLLNLQDGTLRAL